MATRRRVERRRSPFSDAFGFTFRRVFERPGPERVCTIYLSGYTVAAYVRQTRRPGSLEHGSIAHRTRLRRHRQTYDRVPNPRAYTSTSGATNTAVADIATTYTRFTWCQ